MSRPEWRDVERHALARRLQEGTTMSSDRAELEADAVLQLVDAGVPEVEALHYAAHGLAGAALEQLERRRQWARDVVAGLLDEGRA